MQRYAVVEKPVTRSSLADRYPCDACRGDGFVDQEIGSHSIRHTCDDCCGSGSHPDAALAAAIDDWLATKDVTVSTASEHTLRDLLVSTAAGHDCWSELDSPGADPVVSMPERNEIATFVCDLAATLLRESRESDCEYERLIPHVGAYGRLQAILQRLLTAVADGVPLATAMETENRTGMGRPAIRAEV